MGPELNGSEDFDFDSSGNNRWRVEHHNPFVAETLVKRHL